MNIGDILATVHLNLETGEFETNAVKVADSAGASMGQKLTASLKGAWDSGGALGVGVAAGAMAFNALGASVQGAVGFMQNAVKAAMEDEASQAALTQALNANVKGWDGNSKALEDVITARMKLGFDDVAQRESLGLLVAKTGDVTEALNIERAAMDLARLKGIDLAAASKAIAMGMSGSGKALKELGINVKDYAGQAEILTAIQTKAAGQAEAYANTTAGAMEAMQIQIGEATEAIGYKLMPIVRDMALFIRNDAVPAVTSLTDSLGNLADNTGREMDAIAGSKTFLDNLRDGLLYGNDAAWQAARASLGFKDALDAQTAAAAQAAAMTEVYSTGELGAATRAAAMGLQLEGVGTAAADAARQQQGYADGVRLSNDWIVRVLPKLPELAQAFRDTAAAARASRLDEAYGLAELPLQIAVARDAVKAAAKVVKENPLNPQAKIDLLEAQKNLDQYMALLKAEGPNGAIIAAGVGKQIASGLYQGVINWRPGAPVGPTTPGGNRNIDIRAGGGPVTAGMPYIVGEYRPELFVPNEAGRIIPQVQMTNSGSSGASTFTMTGDVVLQAPNFTGTESDKRTLVRSLFDYIQDEGTRRGFSR